MKKGTVKCLKNVWDLIRMKSRNISCINTSFISIFFRVVWPKTVLMRVKVCYVLSSASHEIVLLFQISKPATCGAVCITLKCFFCPILFKSAFSLSIKPRKIPENKTLIYDELESMATYYAREYWKCSLPSSMSVLSVIYFKYKPWQIKQRLLLLSCSVRRALIDCNLSLVVQRQTVVFGKLCTHAMIAGGFS